MGGIAAKFKWVGVGEEQRDLRPGLRIIDNTETLPGACSLVTSSRLILDNRLTTWNRVIGRSIFLIKYEKYDSCLGETFSSNWRRRKKFGKIKFV